MGHKFVFMLVFRVTVRIGEADRFIGLVVFKEAGEAGKVFAREL
jgi:hypothetical protein